jgi:hypothetical protein
LGSHWPQCCPLYGLGGLLCSFFATTGVVEPLAKDISHIQVDNDQLFGELPAPGDDLPPLVQGHAPAIKDEFVLSADQVAERNVDDIVGRPGSQHPLSLGALAGMVWRGRDVDHQLRPGQRLGLGGTRRVPDILTDVDADDRAVQRKNQGALANPKVTILVKDGVIWQVGLVIHSRHLAVVEHGGGVVQVVSSVDKTDHNSDAGRRSGDPLQASEVCRHKAGFEEQVFRWVAGYGQFGKGHHVSALFPGVSDIIQDLFLIASQVTHGGIDLS